MPGNSVALNFAKMRTRCFVHLCSVLDLDPAYLFEQKRDELNPGWVRRLQVDDQRKIVFRVYFDEAEMLLLLGMKGPSVCVFVFNTTTAMKSVRSAIYHVLLGSIDFVIFLLLSSQPTFCGCRSSAALNRYMFDGHRVKGSHNCPFHQQKTIEIVMRKQLTSLLATNVRVR